MKASVQYNDFEGTAAADISDALGGVNGDNIRSIGKFLNLDETRFKIVAISIYGTDDFSISLICVDNKRSTDEKEYLVSMRYDLDDDKKILDRLFKRLHIVLYDRFDEEYVSRNYDSETNFSDYHGHE